VRSDNDTLLLFRSEFVGIRLPLLTLLNLQNSRRSGAISLHPAPWRA